MARRISALLNVVVDLKVGGTTDIKNVIERLECNCIDASGEDVKVVDVKITDRKLLIEEDTEE